MRTKADFSIKVAIVSSTRSRQLELQVTVPVEHSQPTCPVVDMTQEDSVSEARSDSSLSGVLDALEADLESSRGVRVGH